MYGKMIGQYVHTVCHWKCSKYTFEQLLWPYCTFLECASPWYVITIKWNMQYVKNEPVKTVDSGIDVHVFLEVRDITYIMKYD